MKPRESNPTLWVSAALALAVHVAAAVGFVSLDRGGQTPDRQTKINIDRVEDREQPIPIGQAVPSQTNINWVSAEDYRKLLARKEEFDQAAVQATQDPVDRAQTPLDPTPPKPRPSPSPSPAAPIAKKSAKPPAPPQPTVQAPSAPADPKRPLIPAERIPAIDPAPTAVAVASNQEPTPPRPPQATQEPPRPTAAPKEDRESSPVSRLEGLEVKPGEVIARYGVTIKTVSPRWSVASRYAVPGNPDVVVVFDPREGKVIGARLVKSTGYVNVDAPLLASLYRWTAEGEPLKEIPGPFEMRIRVLIVPEPQRAATRTE